MINTFEAQQIIKILDTHIFLTTILLIMVSVFVLLLLSYLVSIRILRFSRNTSTEEVRFDKIKSNLRFNELINDIDLEIIKAIDMFAKTQLNPKAKENVQKKEKPNK